MKAVSVKINKLCKGRIYAKAESLPWKWWNLRKRHHLVAVTENQVDGFGKTALLERKSFYLSYRWQSLLMAEGPQKTCLSLDQNHSSKLLPRRLPVRKDVDFSSCSSWVPDHGLTSCVWHLCFVALWHVGSSQTGDQTPVPCIAWRVLNHWTTRETPRRF